MQEAEILLWVGLLVYVQTLFSTMAFRFVGKSCLGCISEDVWCRIFNFGKDIVWKVLHCQCVTLISSCHSDLDF